MDKQSLQAENKRLRQQLSMWHDRALETEALFRRHQDWEVELLTITTLDRLLLYLTQGMRDRFQVDVVRLLLDDDTHDVRGLLSRIGNNPRQFSDVIFVSQPDTFPEYLAQLKQLYLGPIPAGQEEPLFNRQESVRSVALLPLLREQQLLGVLGIGSFNAERYTAEMGTYFLSRLGAICAVCLENAINRARLEIGSLTDALTGLHNRRSLDLRLKDELARACRYGQPLSCVFLDLDFFKQINDEYGHAAGDAVLMQLAERLHAALRACDIAARFGGDELTVLLPGTDADEAMRLANRIHRIIIAQPFKLTESVSLSLTASIGVATSLPLAEQHEMTRWDHDLLHAADMALYESKRAGRNRVSYC
jgi:diguanylate cyclase (GGDEF)-like protein